MVPDDVVALFVARLFNYPVPVSQRLVKPHFVLTILRMQTSMIFLFLNTVRARFLLFIDVSHFAANLLCRWIIMLTRSLEYIFSKIFSSYYFVYQLRVSLFIFIAVLEYNCVVHRFTLQNLKKISTI